MVKRREMTIFISQFMLLAESALSVKINELIKGVSTLNSLPKLSSILRCY